MKLSFSILPSSSLNLFWKAIGMHLAGIAFGSAPSLRIIWHSPSSCPIPWKTFWNSSMKEVDFGIVLSTVSISLIIFSFLLVSKPRISMGISFTTEKGCVSLHPLVYAQMRLQTPVVGILCPPKLVNFVLEFLYERGWLWDCVVNCQYQLD